MIRTVSLETAKMLRNAEFGKDTHLAYCFLPKGQGWATKPHKEKYRLLSDYGNNNLTISAPTTDELLEELPCCIEYNGIIGPLVLYKETGGWCVGYLKSDICDDFHKQFDGEELCECLAQLWLWLKKEGLI